MAVEYRKKCELCKQYFQVKHSGRKYCKMCIPPKKEQVRKTMAKKIRQKNNQAKKENNSMLVNRNPEGNNQHTNNPSIPELKLTLVEEFAKLSDIEQKKMIAELGNELYMIKKEIRPKLVRFTKYKDYYEFKHFGWDWNKE